MAHGMTLNIFESKIGPYKDNCMMFLKAYFWHKNGRLTFQRVVNLEKYADTDLFASSELLKKVVSVSTRKIVV